MVDYRYSVQSEVRIQMLMALVRGSILTLQVSLPTPTEHTIDKWCWGWG